jgi:uncharacterized protein YkwD
VFSRRRLVLLAVFLSGCSPTRRRIPPEQAEALEAGVKDIEGQLFEAVNAVRVREGVPELRWHSGAAAEAKSHSRAMA